jgi:hypothetical protein
LDGNFFGIAAFFDRIFLIFPSLCGKMRHEETFWAAVLAIALRRVTGELYGKA